MADVAINKRTVLVTNPASQQDFPGSTAPPVISPDVEVNFLELVDTPDTYTGQDGKFVRVKDDEDGLQFINQIEANKFKGYLVKNQTGGTLLKGKVARAVGTLGASGRILIDYAIADGTHLPKFVMGLIYEDIPDGQDGYVVDFGQIRNVNTNAFNEGDVLWLSPTVAGDLTATKPTAPDYKVLLALVIRKDAVNGELQVRVNFGEFLTDLHDVENAGSTGDALVKQASGIYQFEKVKPSNLDQEGAVNGEVLTWNNITEQWEPAAGGGGDTVTGDETRGIEVTEPTAGNKVVAKKYYNVFLPFTATMTLELKEGRRHIFTATSDFVLANPSNILSYEGRVEIVITQGLGGGHQISSVGDRVIFPNGTIPTLNGTFGESDWLRGTVVNGYLLIYQIESLAAPGIDLPPIPEPPALPYTALYSFFDLDSTQSNSADYERTFDNVESDLTYLQNRVNVNSVNAHLKASTRPSAYGRIFQTTQLWKDQSGNSNDLSPNTNSDFPLIFNSFFGAFGSFSTNNLQVTSSATNGLNQFTYTLVAYGFGNLQAAAGLYEQRILAGGILTLGVNNANDKYLQLIIKRQFADANTIIVDNEPFVNYKWCIIQIIADYSTGAVELFVNNKSVGSDTMASTGIVPDDITHRFFGNATNEFLIAYFSIKNSVASTDYLAERTFVNDLHGDLIVKPTVTGKDIYGLFDVIISPDRLSYSPYAINVRESITNTEKVISYDSNGLFDVTEFNAHIGAGYGFSVAVRNVANPSLSLSQSTAARQLKVITSAYNGRTVFEGSITARRSLNTTNFVLNGTAKHYYFFLPLTVSTVASGVTQWVYQVTGSSNDTRMAAGIINDGGVLKNRIAYRRLGSDATKFAQGSTALTSADVILLTYHFDYVNGVNKVYINQGLDINDTVGYIGNVAMVQNFYLGNLLDNFASGYNEKFAGIFILQGEMTSAQRIAIETELMNTYGIS